MGLFIDALVAHIKSEIILDEAFADSLLQWLTTLATSTLRNLRFAGTWIGWCWAGVAERKNGCPGRSALNPRGYWSSTQRFAWHRAWSMSSRSWATPWLS